MTTITFHAPLYQVIPRIGAAAAMGSPAAVPPEVKPAPRIPPAAAVEPTPKAPIAPVGPTAEQLLSQIADSLEARKQHDTQSMEEVHRLAVELAIVVAAKLTYEKVESDTFAIESLVGELLGEFGPAESLRVRLHPLDLALLEKNITGTTPPWSAQHEIQFDADTTLPRGSCQVDTESYGLITDLPTRIEIIRHRLLDGMEHARIERRKAAAGSAGVQRFPERRKAP